MKLINTLTIASILFAAVSCSMEDDLMNDVTKAQDDANKTEAYISLNVNAPLTKAPTSTNGAGGEWYTADSVVTNCSIILLDGTTVIKAIDGAVIADVDGHQNTVVKDGNLVKFLVKVKKAYGIVIVANSSATFDNTGIKTYADIENKLQGINDLNTFVKFGKTSKTITTGFESTTDALAHPEFVTIELEQLSARIEVAQFNVTGFTKLSLEKEVKITKVELLNRTIKSYTQKAEQIAGDDCYDSPVVWDFNSTPISVYNETNKIGYTFEESEMPLFYSFRNVDGNKPAAIKIYYTVGGQARETREIVIKHEDKTSKIESGYLYRLNINMAALTFDDIEISVKCYTKDWDWNKLTYIF